MKREKVWWSFAWSMSSVCCTPCSEHCLLLWQVVTLGESVSGKEGLCVFIFRLLLILMRELWREERVFDLHPLLFGVSLCDGETAATAYHGLLWGFQIFFLHVDCVCLAQQHQRHWDLLFIPLERCCDTVRVQYFISTAGCVFVRVCVWGWIQYGCTSSPIQQLFLSSFSPSLSVTCR